MKALVLEDIGQIAYKDIAKPSPQRGEALVKVHAAGICGSDIPRTYRDGAHNMPLVIGHEFAGCVEDVGEGVSSDLIGKRVGVFPLIPCKKCRLCLGGKYEMCKNYNYLGSRCNGGFAEYVTVPEWNLIELPANVSYEAAAMLEPMAVAVHAMTRSKIVSARAAFERALSGDNSDPRSKIVSARAAFERALSGDNSDPRSKIVSARAAFERALSGDNSDPRSKIVSARAAFERTVSDDITVAVCGLGTIGTLLVQFLLEAGYNDLIVIGNKDFQRKTITALGVPDECYCDSRKTDARDFIMDHTDKRGADVFFECVGNNDTVSLAVDCAAAGGSVCFVGNPHSDMTFEKAVYWKILRNQLNISGTWNSSYLGRECLDDDWHYVLSRLEKGSIQPEKLITHKYTLEELIKGFELMRDKSEDYIKVMYSDKSL